MRQRVPGTAAFIPVLAAAVEMLVVQVEKRCRFRLPDYHEWPVRVRSTSDQRLKETSLKAKNVGSQMTDTKWKRKTRIKNKRSKTKVKDRK